VKIEIVQLENIRSHVKSAVPFAKGFNCLVGGVGCGKSSILYSIDFALFGEPVGRSYEYLLREGADNGRVTLQFVQDGKTYRITRGLKKHGKGISQDMDELRLFEGEDLISSLKGDAIAEQFKAITGLDKDLFRAIVWVKQERLKELLDAAPRERQKRLDEMFGLSDYEVAWSNLASYQRDYEVEKRVYERDPDITGMEKLSAEYNRIVEEFSRIEIDLQATRSRLEVAKKALDEADAELGEMEGVKTLNEQLKRKEAGILANITNLNQTLASLEQKIASNGVAVENLKQRLGIMESQAESCRGELQAIGLPTDQPLEILRKSLNALDDKVSSLKGEREAALKNAQTDDRRTSSLSAENRCPLCLQSLTQEYKDGLVQRIQGENSERQALIDQLQRDIEELQRKKSKANDAFSKLQMLDSNIENLRSRMSDESQAFTDYTNETSAKQKQEADLHAELDAVRIEISRFDASELEAAKNRQKEANKQYYQLNSDFRIKENRKKDLVKRMDEVKDRIDQAQQKIERLGRITQAAEIIGDMRDAYRSIQPKLRGEFVKVLRNFVQQVLDSLIGSEGAMLNIAIDETYTPYVRSENGIERDVSNLSGGERTLVAFAYRLGLGQLIMQSRTGHGLSLLLLDEPTESLGREDRSIDRLAEAISRFKAVEQVIAVTHSEAFAEKAEHVIRLEKDGDESRVSIER
jgi:exonuclease SbcC